MTLRRCAWPHDELNVQYHDCEWGVPVHDDRHLFEILILDGAQAGLSWSTILKKREGYRAAFAGFYPSKVARFTEHKIEALLLNPAIVRNRLKVNSAVTNARAFLRVQKEFGSFDAYLWGFVDGKPVQNTWKTIQQIPAKTPLSDAVSKDLTKRGFKFVGSTICYAIMQTIGMVNDHTVDCFRYKEIARMQR